MKRTTAGKSLLLLTAGTAALHACSAMYGLKAGFLNGRLAFTTDHPPPASYPYCGRDVTVAEDGGRVMWSYQFANTTAEPIRCPPVFPIVYGAAPRGAKTRVAAKPLVSGRSYYVTAGAGESYEGVFTYAVRTLLSVDNLDRADFGVKEIMARASDNDILRPENMMEP